MDIPNIPSGWATAVGCLLPVSEKSAAFSPVCRHPWNLDFGASAGIDMSPVNFKVEFFGKLLYRN